MPTRPLQFFAPLIAIVGLPLIAGAEPPPASHPALSASQQFPAIDARQAELVAAATVDARGRLGQAVLETPLKEGWTIRRVSRRLDCEPVLFKALASIEPSGSPRWQESGICQVRVEFPGSVIADLLTAASQKARDPDLSPPKIGDSLVRLRTLTFSAVGQSVAPDELGKVTGDWTPAWVRVPAAERVAALQSARTQAIGKLLEQLRPVPLVGDKTLNDVFAKEEAVGPVRGYLMQRPVSGIEFRTGLECRVTFAVPADRLWPVVREVIGQSAAGPQASDVQAWSRLYEAFSQACTPVTGIGRAGPPTPIRDLIPAAPPAWVADQVDADGKSTLGGLKGARAAETSAMESLTQKVRSLPLGVTTLGEAADRDPALGKAIQGFVQQSRVSRVIYQADGVSVRVSADLAQLWRELLTIR